MRLAVRDSLLRLEQHPVAELTPDLLLRCRELLPSARCSCARVRPTCLRHARRAEPINAGGGSGQSLPDGRGTATVVGLAKALAT